MNSLIKHDKGSGEMANGMHPGLYEWLGYGNCIILLNTLHYIS